MNKKEIADIYKSVICTIHNVLNFDLPIYNRQNIVKYFLWQVVDKGIDPSLLDCDDILINYNLAKKENGIIKYWKKDFFKEPVPVEPYKITEDDHMIGMLMDHYYDYSCPTLNRPESDINDVKRWLHNKDKEENSREFFAILLRDKMLTDNRIEEGYGIEDVKSFIDFLDEISM